MPSAPSITDATSPMYPAIHPAKIAREIGADFVFDNSRANNAPMMLLAIGNTNSTYDNTVSEMNDAIAQIAYDTPNPKNSGAQGDCFVCSYSSIGIGIFGRSSLWYVNTLASTDANGVANNVAALMVIKIGFSNMVLSTFLVVYS